MRIQSLSGFSNLEILGQMLTTSSIRRFVCNRHEYRNHYDIVDFVPTQAEADALEELNTITARKDKDDETDKNLSFLVSALRFVQRVTSVEIESENPFLHPILRKVWDEYSLEAYRQPPYRESQFLKILHAARISGLMIQHFSHDQQMASCFADGGLRREHGFTLHDDINSLKSLRLSINDRQGLFFAGGRAVLQLRQLISASRVLEDLSVDFVCLKSIPLDFLPATPTGTLQSLSLCFITVHPAKLLAFLEGHASTVKRLHLKSSDIPQGFGSWRDFLEDLREAFGHRLEKFHVSGMVRSVDGNREQWLLWPRYDQDWNVFENERTPRTRELEDFVLRSGSWPMVASDTWKNLPAMGERQRIWKLGNAGFADFIGGLWDFSF
jgi:hypothetical protein